MKLKEVMTSMDYEKLYKAYYLQVYSYTISLAKNREIAEEITQNTFYKAVSTTSQFKGKSDEQCKRRHGQRFYPSAKSVQ